MTPRKKIHGSVRLSKSHKADMLTSPNRRSTTDAQVVRSQDDQERQMVKVDNNKEIGGLFIPSISEMRARR